MASQIHEIQLRIDASAAESGRRQFVSAIEAIKKSVAGLDRDTRGVFTAISKATRAPATPALAAGFKDASAAIRQAEASATQLHRRLTTIGDTTGLDRTSRAMATLRADLAGGVVSTDTLRAAQTRFKNEIHEVQEQLRSTTYLEQQGQAYARLQASLDPAAAASLAYSRAVENAQRAQRSGAISTQAMTTTIERAKLAYLGADNAAAAATAQQTRFFRSMAGGHGPMRQTAMQLSQVGQSYAATGQLMQSALVQVPDLLLPFGTIPVLIGAAVGAMAPFLISLLKGKAGAEDLKDSFQSLESGVSSYRSANELARSSVRDLTADFGDQAESVRENLRLLSEHSFASVVADLRNVAKQTKDAYADIFKSVDAFDAAPGPFRNERGFDMRRQLEDIGLTEDAARSLRTSLNDLATATGPEQSRAVFARILDTMRATYGTIDAMPRPMQLLQQAILQGDVAAAKLLATANGTATAADNASSAAADLTYQIGTAADEGARLLANIGSVPGALSALQGSVADQVASIGAQNRSLTIQLEEGRSAAAANRTVQLQDLVAGVGSGGIRVDDAANAAIEIERLEAAEREQKRLQDALSAASKSTSTKPAGGGGGKGRAAALSEEAKESERLTNTIRGRIAALESEEHAQDLVASGMFRSSEAARLYADAARQNGGAVDDATAAMLRQLDTMNAINEAAQNDPVQAYLDAIPSLQDAQRQVTTTLAQGAENSLTDAFVGNFDPGKLAEQLRQSMARVAAQQVIGKLFGGTFESGLAGGVVRGSQTGAQVMGAAISTAGAQAAQAMAVAISTGSAASSATSAASGAAGAAAGAGGGNGLGSILRTGASLLTGGFFREGGVSTSPVSSASLPSAMFAAAPHYAEGTANTSGGIPAILHDNEAVIPLSRGRKVPVEVSGKGGGGGAITTGDIVANVTVNSTGDADADPALLAKAISAALEEIVMNKLAESMAYGGVLNPRGG